MISAQLTWKSPAGKVFVYEPGMTTLLAGTLPLYSMEEVYAREVFQKPWAIFLF